VASAGGPRIKCPRKPSGAPARRKKVTSFAILVSLDGGQPNHKRTCKEENKINTPIFFL
jgi:hypothetical protein